MEKNCTTIKDSGNNADLKIIIDNKELNLKHCVGYELERSSENNEHIKLKVIYEINNYDLEIKKA